jgi:peptidoglycan/LPS O-acetylase OafA/YrhL
MARNDDQDIIGPQQVARAQFSTVHALRGFAALWVVLFHARNFGGFQGVDVGQHGTLGKLLFDYGRGGVAIFFVLSGFVIAHSLWQSPMTGRAVTHFMVRRSIRLDPPYWASIAFALAIVSARGIRHGGSATFDPGIILLHMLYLQELLRVPEIQVVYWTLTYEIQFYLVYALLLWWMNRATSSRFRRSIVFAPGALLLLCAFIAAAMTREWVIHGLFLNYWHAFAAGVLAYMGGFRRSKPALVLCLALASIMLVSAPATPEVFNTPAALAAILLALLGRSEKLSGFASRPFKALGTISYSLYLVHVPTIIVLESVCGRILVRSPIGAIESFVCIVAGCLVTATMFWWAIEKPTHAFAKRIPARR